MWLNIVSSILIDTVMVVLPDSFGDYRVKGCVDKYKPNIYIIKEVYPVKWYVPPEKQQSDSVSGPGLLILELSQYIKSGITTGIHSTVYSWRSLLNFVDLFLTFINLLTRK